MNNEVELVNPEAQILIDFVKVWQPKKILEVGCNTGTELRLLSSFGAELFGVDNDPTKIEQAEQLLPTAKFSVTDAVDLPFKDNSIDLVYSSGGILSHNPPDKISNILDEMFRVSKNKILLIEYLGTKTTPENYTNVKKGSFIHNYELLLASRVYTPIFSTITPINLDRFYVFACTKGIYKVDALAIDIESKLRNLENQVSRLHKEVQNSQIDFSEKMDAIKAIVSVPWWKKIFGVKE